MIAPPECSAERDAAIAAMLPHVPFDGWTRTALRRGLAASGADRRDAALLFPDGAADMIAAFCDLADRRMAAAMTAPEYAAMRTTARVRATIALRLEQNRPHREAIRRALAVLALPGNAAVAAGLHRAHRGRDLAGGWRPGGGFLLVHEAGAAGRGLYARPCCSGCAAPIRTPTTPQPLRSWIDAWPGSGGSAACADGRSPGSAACCPRRCAAFELTKARPGAVARGG